jgi:hypothetical protein
MNDGRCFAAAGERRRIRPSSKLSGLLFLTGRTFPAELRRSRGDDGFGDGQANPLVGDAVRLVLKRIVDLSDSKLPLYDA